MNNEAISALIAHLQGRVLVLENLLPTIMFNSMVGSNLNQKKFIIEKLEENLSDLKQGQEIRLKSAKASSDNKNIELSEGVLYAVNHYSQAILKWKEALEKTEAENSKQ